MFCVLLFGTVFTLKYKKWGFGSAMICILQALKILKGLNLKLTPVSSAQNPPMAPHYPLNKIYTPQLALLALARTRTFSSPGQGGIVPFRQED